MTISSIAGSDTTTTTLSYLLWELSRRRDVLVKLQAELDQYVLGPRSLPSFETLQTLPYLNAVIKEGNYSLELHATYFNSFETGQY